MKYDRKQINKQTNKKMTQRRDNAGAVCESNMDMLFLNRKFLSYRRLMLMWIFFWVGAKFQF